MINSIKIWWDNFLSDRRQRVGLYVVVVIIVFSGVNAYLFWLGNSIDGFIGEEVSKSNKMIGNLEKIREFISNPQK